jgi:hypothetical protein
MMNPDLKYINVHKFNTEQNMAKVIKWLNKVSKILLTKTSYLRN